MIKVTAVLVTIAALAVISASALGSRSAAAVDRSRSSLQTEANNRLAESGATSTATRTPVVRPTITPTPIAPSPAPTASSASITITPQTLTAGTVLSLRVDGTGFGPSETVWVGYTAVLSGGGTAVEQTSVAASAVGAFTVSALTVPGDIYPAPHEIKAIGQSTGRVATATLTVLAPPSAATPTPSATSTPGPPTKFRLSVVRVQLTSKPDWSAKAPSASTLTVGQAVDLAIYVQMQQVPEDGALSVTWQVTREGRVVAHHGKHIGVAAGSTGRYWTFWKHAFIMHGPYIFTASATLNGVKHSRQVTFNVYRRS